MKKLLDTKITQADRMLGKRQTKSYVRKDERLDTRRPTEKTQVAAG